MKRKSNAAWLTRILVCGGLAMAALPAAAELENRVTVRGTSTVGEVIAAANLSISVAPAAPALAVTVEAEPEGRAGAGDTVRLTYRVENTGNVTLSGLRLRIEQEGAGTAPLLALVRSEETGEAAADVAEDGSLAWPEPLAPGEAALFSASYSVVQDDLENNGGGDGLLDARAFAVASFAGSEASAESSFQIALEEISATLEVAKSADRTENVAAGDVITYTYTVTNTGNVTISAISLTETHNGSGPPPRPSGETLLADNGVTGDSSDRETDGTWDRLGPGDVITFTATYTVTQADVDTLQ